MQSVNCFCRYFVWSLGAGNEIDRMYDYRYSVLPLVLANLLTSGRLVEDELHGLREDKLACIKRAAMYLRNA